MLWKQSMTLERQLKSCEPIAIFNLNASLWIEISVKKKKKTNTQWLKLRAVMLLLKHYSRGEGSENLIQMHEKIDVFSKSRKCGETCIFLFTMYALLNAL